MAVLENYLTNIRALFRYYKSLGEKAISQLDDEQLTHLFDPETNSIAMIVKHLSGNMRSRWTDFLTTDGEKPWRNREQEFDNDLATKSAILEAWEQGWSVLFEAIDPLVVADLERVVFIRNEGHSVLEALNRQLAHYSYHVGQIVFIAKTLKGNKWMSLSIPKGGSETFNAEKFGQEKGGKTTFPKV